MKTLVPKIKEYTNEFNRKWDKAEDKSSELENESERNIPLKYIHAKQLKIRKMQKRHKKYAVLKE